MQQAHLFVAVLGASSYTYAEVTADEQLASWIGAHVRAFEFYQGVPKLVVPDNTKTGVTKACRYQSVKSILKNSLDTVPPVEPPPSSPPPPHGNIRGAEYFD